MKVHENDVYIHDFLTKLEIQNRNLIDSKNTEIDKLGVITDVRNVKIDDLETAIENKNRTIENKNVEIDKMGEIIDVRNVTIDKLEETIENKNRIIENKNEIIKHLKRKLADSNLENHLLKRRKLTYSLFIYLSTFYALLLFEKF